MTPRDVIPDEAVKLAALALYGDGEGAEWVAADAVTRVAYIEEACEVLRAAYPAIRAQVVADICKALRAQGAAIPAEYDTLTGAAGFIERREAQR